MSDLNEASKSPESDMLRRGTVLLDPEAGAPAVIDPGWRPEAMRPVVPGMTSATWLLAGFTTLLLIWLGLAAVGAASDAFARSVAFGWAVVLAFAAGASMLGWAGWVEFRAFRALGRVDRLRGLLGDHNQPIAAARASARDWMAAVGQRVPDLAAAERAVDAAASLSELRAVLAHRVATPLAQAAAQVGTRAAIEAGALVALCPHPALDALFAGLRGLKVMREVATIYGLRPGMAANLGLARRVAATAAGTAGLDLLSQTLSDHLLQRMPVISHVVGAIPGATMTAVRLYRLARICAVACSPLTPRADL